jgi:hypothetical protein
MTLDKWLESLGFAVISSLLKIKVDDGGVDLDFPEWISVDDDRSALVHIQANELTLHPDLDEILSQDYIYRLLEENGQRNEREQSH